MGEITTFTTYRELKELLNHELSRIAEGFVKIGYLLKVARDTDILKDSGYATVAEFAKTEYGLTKDVVSRWIAINDRYSEGGYSDRLQEKYKNYGVAKLAEMLTLPDSIIEEIHPQLTRAEMQEVKREISEENKISDVEVLLEGQQDQQAQLNTLTEKLIHQYFYDNREEFQPVYSEVLSDDTIIHITEKILDAIAPSGVAVKMTRVQGVGKLMMSIKGSDQDIDIMNVRTNEKETYTWGDFIRTIRNLYQLVGLDKPIEIWERVYGEPFKKPEVAPVQPDINVPELKEETISSEAVQYNNLNKKPEDKNQSTDAEEVNNKDETETIEAEVIENQSEKEPLLADIESDVMMNTPVSKNDIQELRCKQLILEDIKRLEAQANNQSWNKVKLTLKDMLHKVEHLLDGKELEEDNA